MRTRKAAFAILILYIFRFAGAQAVRLSKADIERRVDSLLSHMSLEGKITYIGGIDDYFTRRFRDSVLPV